jgi:hypothetical protein
MRGGSWPIGQQFGEKSGWTAVWTLLIHKEPCLSTSFPHLSTDGLLWSGDVKKKGSGFSSKRYRRQVQTRLIIGGWLILLVVGGGLVWAIYGLAAAGAAVACLTGAAGLLALLWLILSLLERWVKEEEP